ncbi:MAG: histidine phosphatase family protein [Gammaproteobacteria bacterium]|nr:histidine phosphatase family protein [Gammaproteobacteria bacterium]
MKNIVVMLFVIISLQPLSAFSDTDDEIWKKLRDGGLVVLMRHASVDRGDSLVRDPGCLKESMLSEKGKAQAARVGELFRSMRVNISQVLSSPYCRTTDTAKIAFGQAQAVAFLSLLEGLAENEVEENTEWLAKTIGAYTGSDNLVLVTHAPNISTVSFETVEKAAFVVFQPLANQEFEELGKISPEKNNQFK